MLQLNSVQGYLLQIEKLVFQLISTTVGCFHQQMEALLVNCNFQSDKVGLVKINNHFATKQQILEISIFFQSVK